MFSFPISDISNGERFLLMCSLQVASLCVYIRFLKTATYSRHGCKRHMQTTFTTVTLFHENAQRLASCDIFGPRLTSTNSSEAAGLDAVLHSSIPHSAATGLKCISSASHANNIHSLTDHSAQVADVLSDIHKQFAGYLVSLLHNSRHLRSQSLPHPDMSPTRITTSNSRTHWTSDSAPIFKGSRYAPLAKPEEHRESLASGFVACVLGVVSTGVMQRSAIGASG